jgi:hypothetical protein
MSNGSEVKRWHPEMGGGPMPEPKTYETWDDVAAEMITYPGGWDKDLYEV